MLLWWEEGEDDDESLRKRSRSFLIATTLNLIATTLNLIARALSLIWNNQSRRLLVPRGHRNRSTMISANCHRVIRELIRELRDSCPLQWPYQSVSKKIIPRCLAESKEDEASLCHKSWDNGNDLLIQCYRDSHPNFKVLAKKGTYNDKNDTSRTQMVTHHTWSGVSGFAQKWEWNNVSSHQEMQSYHRDSNGHGSHKAFSAYPG
jgi:hypothetical protein